jgi:hypothetical protein
VSKVPRSIRWRTQLIAVVSSYGPLVPLRVNPTFSNSVPFDTHFDQYQNCSHQYNIHHFAHIIDITAVHRIAAGRIV